MANDDYYRQYLKPKLEAPKVEAGPSWRQDAAYPPSRLSGSARFIRGFKRVGLFLAAPIAVIGVPICLYNGFQDIPAAHARYQQAKCIVGKLSRNEFVSRPDYNKLELYYDASGCPGPAFMDYDSAVFRTAQAPPDDFQSFTRLGVYGTALVIASSFAIFGLFWSIGWVLAGFTRD